MYVETLFRLFILIDNLIFAIIIQFNFLFIITYSSPGKEREEAYKAVIIIQHNIMNVY